MNISTLKRRAASLKNRLHNLQADIYNFASDLEDQANNNLNDKVGACLLKYSELASESGFELDVSHQKMGEIIDHATQTFGRQNYNK